MLVLGPNNVFQVTGTLRSNVPLHEEDLMNFHMILNGNSIFLKK